jgi:DNA-damage-inducible protein D
VEQSDVFHFDDDRESFDDYVQENGHDFWYARDLMKFLDYGSYRSFETVINRAIAACMTLGIDVMDNFTKIDRDIDGRKQKDCKLSKFACYLVAMNGDPKKEQVAKAQIYFVTVAETLRHHLEEHENFERLLIRDDISEREKSISGVAKSHGVTTYPLFQNAGYRGMYNRNMKDLKKYKGLTNLRRSLLDYMGKEELAANLFRLTQTEAKIKNENIRGQAPLEVAAETVGRQVRKAMQEMSGTRPEDLPLSDDIKSVKKQLKKTHKKMLSDGK